MEHPKLARPVQLRTTAPQNDTNIITMMTEVVGLEYDSEVAKSFEKDILDYYGGYSFTSESDHQQINLINKYFRYMLRVYNSSSTVGVRAWLVECDDIVAYVKTFETTWIHLLSKLQYFERLM